jgi:hypothetical protein
VTQLITLAGGSNTVQSGFGQAPSVGNLISSKNYPNEALVSIAGGMLNGTTYLLDGGTHNDVFNNLSFSRVSVRLKKISPFRHSSRKRPLKLSM